VGREMCIKESKAWSVASIEIVCGWPYHPGSMTWPVFMLSEHGPSTHFLTSQLAILFPQIPYFFVVFCKFRLFLLIIWKLLGKKKIPKTPFVKFAHDFVLRQWFQKFAKNKINYHHTGGAILFINIRYPWNTLRNFSEYFTENK
jgi:hypothetical protein